MLTTQQQYLANRVARRWQSWKHTTSQELYSVGQVELPRLEVDTTYTLPTGTTYTLSDTGVMGDGSTPSDYTSLQSALNALSGGDILLIRNASVFTGQFTLPATSGGYIYVMPEDTSFLPAGGSRTKPTRDGTGEYPVIRTDLGGSGAALRTLVNGVNHWRFIGIKFTIDEASLGDGSSVTGVVRFDPSSPLTVADLPSYMLFDRCWFYGFVSTPSKTINIKHALYGHGQHIGLFDSWSEKIGGVGDECQCFNALMGDGPFKIQNCYLEATTENMLFGGATGAIGGAIMQDVVIRGNHIYKPQTWNENAPEYDGVNLSCKNDLELKFGNRVLIEDNVLEGSWPPDQDGFALSLKVGGENLNGYTTHVTVRNNDFSRCAGGVNINTDLSPTFPGYIAIYNNRFSIEAGSDFGSKGRGIQFYGSHGEIHVRNNTWVGVSNTGYIVIAFANNTVEGWDFRDNIFTTMGMGIKGDSTGEGTGTISAYCTDAFCEGNLFTGRSSGSYPANNYFPANDAAIGFVDQGGGDYRLDAGSAYKGAGTDGKDPGCDIDALEAAISGVVI